MIRRLSFGFVVVLVTAFIVVACGRQVTPNPPGLGPGGAPPGYSPSAQGYAELARDLGINPGSIVVLDTALDTRQEAQAIAALIGSVLIAGCRDAASARQLGFIPVHGVGAALAMARGAGAERIGFLLCPPPFPLIGA